MVLDTPSLQARVLLYQTSAEQALVAAPEQSHPGPEPEVARFAACQIFAAQRTLADDNRQQLTAGVTAKERYPDAVRAADRTFGLLRDGLGAVYGT